MTRVIKLYDRDDQNHMIQLLYKEEPYNKNQLTRTIEEEPIN